MSVFRCACVSLHETAREGGSSLYTPRVSSLRQSRQEKVDMEDGPKQWTCKRVGCSFATDDERLWESHVNNHDVPPEVLDNGFQIGVSDSSTNNMNHVQDYSDCDGESGTAYVCPKCGRLCSDKDSVELHTQTCGQNDVEPSGHVETGVSRRTYRCQICHERFSWHGNLTRHLEEVHKIIKKRSSVTAGKAQWECDKCNYKAMYGSELERHKRLHKNIKPFACIFCEYNSSWKSDLKRHYEGHHKDKLGDEKLNDIMTRYKNNAGTHLESQTIDREKIASIVLNSPPTDKGAETKAASLQEANGSPSKCPDNESVILEKSFDTMGSQDSPDSQFAHVRCQLCPFSCHYEWDLRKHYSHEHPKMEKEAVSSPASHTDDSVVYPVDLATKLSSFRPSFAAQDTDSLKEEKSDDEHRLLQILKASSMPPGVAGFPHSDAISSLAQYDSSTGPLSLSLGLGLSGAAAFANMMSMSMMTLPGVHMYPATSHASGVSASPTKDSSPLVPPPPPLTASVHSPRQSPTAEVGGNISTATGGDSTEEDSLGSLTTRGRRRGPNKSANERNHRRFKCSQCAHRSNWKWDINKHIKVAHPGAKGARLIVLSEEEAVATLQQYLAESGGKKRSGREREGYYRPYKCSECGKRSNWEWDTNNHIKKSHNGLGQVVKLSYEESVRTIEEYMNSKKHPSEIVASKDPSFRSSPRKDALNLKRFKCNECGYRSNYRSDIKRHINRKHKNNGKVIILTELEARDSLKSYVDNFPQRSNALFKKSIPPELLASGSDKADSQPVHSDKEAGREEDSLDVFPHAAVPEDGKARSADGLGPSPRYYSRTKVWTCRICEVPFRSVNKQEVFKHIARIHPNDKPFVCEACGVGSDYRNSLIRHIRTKHRELLCKSTPSDLCCTNVDHFREDASRTPSVDNGTDNERATSPDNDSLDGGDHKKKLIIEMVQPELVMVDEGHQDAAIDYSLPKAGSSSSVDAIDLSVKGSPPCKPPVVEDSWGAVDGLSNRDWHCIKYKLNKVAAAPAVEKQRSGDAAAGLRYRIYRCRHCSHFSSRRSFVHRRRRLRTKAEIQRRSETRKAFGRFAKAAVREAGGAGADAGGQRLFLCQICPFRHEEEEAYVQHVWHHGRADELCVQCDLCSYRSRDDAAMAGHRKLHDRD